jgi:hypothetical protein
MTDPIRSHATPTMPGTTANRRARVRYLTDRESMCQPGEGRLDQAWWLARIADISTIGIGLVLRQLRQKFPAGTLQTRVVHMTPHPEGGWVLGCEFVHPLTEEDVKALL